MVMFREMELFLEVGVRGTHWLLSIGVTYISILAFVLVRPLQVLLREGMSVEENHTYHERFFFVSLMCIKNVML